MWGNRPWGRLAAVLAFVLVAGPASVPAAVAAPVAPAAPPSAGTDAVSGSVSLGQSALNGTVRAALIDDATGVTYLGGDFTRIGRRTGGTAVVDLPGVSDGVIQAGSPEVLGDVEAVFADDRPGDPGFFLVGRIAGINGSAVSQSQPVHRIHRVDGAWVRDPGWSVTGECNVGNIKFPLEMPWVTTDRYLVGGALAGASTWMGSVTGIVVIDRVTGVLRSLGDSFCSAGTLLPSIPDLPALAGCGSKTHCDAYVGKLAWDPHSKLLLVSYWYVIGNATYVSGDGLAAYDLAASGGGRRWTLALQAGPLGGPGRSASVTGAGALPGAFMVTGSFPLDADTSERAVSRRLLVNAADGAIRQRWSSGGEQDLADGSIIDPGSDCTNHSELPTTVPARVGSQLYAWIAEAGYLCRYGLADGSLAAERVGSLWTDWSNDRLEPSTPYVADDGTTYLLGSHAAVDVTHGTGVSWNPDPAMNAGAGEPSVTVAGGSAVVAGDFRFLRGRPMPAVAALDASLAPLDGFASPLAEPSARAGVRALAFAEGRLLVGGQELGVGTGSLAALDLATGAVAWAPGDAAMQFVDDVVAAPDGSFWAGGMTMPETPGAAIRHYAAVSAGGAALPAPVLGCLDAPVLNGGPSDPTCVQEWSGRTRVRTLLLDADGRLTFGGSFGTVDGVARRGLARLEADGSLSGWNPDLMGIIPIPADGGLAAMEPMSMALLADNLVVGGHFARLVVNPGGGFWEQEISPLLVFSASTGALLRPTDPERTTWLELGGWWPYGYDMAPTDGGLVIALGEPGMGIFDATTFDLDTVSSAPYLDPNWLTPIGGNGMYALATRTPSGAPVPAAQTAATPDIQAEAPEPLVIGGAIPRWRYRVAGNVLRTTVAPDTTAPVTSGVRVTPRSGTVTGSGSTAVRITWTAADPKGSGAASYDVSWSVNGGAWQTVRSGVKTRYADATLRPGTSYRFRVRARDNAGNLGAFSAGPTITTAVVQQSSSAVRYSSGWKTAMASAYLGGSVKAHSASGATATYSFTGRGVGFVTTLGPSRGRARVYVDGRYVTTLDLRSATSRYRTVAFAKSWTSPGTHSLRLAVSGTAGRPRVDVDAFVVVR